MGIKYKLSLCILIGGVIVLILTLIIFPKETNYEDKLIAFFRRNDATTVGDIFTFDFSCAYVFDDCYISGAGLVERYDLDICIPQVKTGISENIQRIVFVDEHGLFLYEFRCDCRNIMITETGIVIYPETIIERVSHNQQGTIKLFFHSQEFYNQKVVS